jgi:hypothetical protein
MFEVIKKTKSKTNDISSILADSVSFSYPKMIAEKFNEFFTGVAQKIADEIPPASMPDNFFNTPPNQPIFDYESAPVTSSEIVDVIKELKVQKTLDCNGLSTLLLSKHALTLSTPLKHVISLSLNTGIVPVQLKIAKVIPIFKSGDKQQLDNYRPISLLNVFSKIYERVVYNRLVTFLNINQLLSPYQFGFRKGHSTVHPVTLFMNSVSESLNNKKHSIAIFCDLKMAFDTVDHSILLKKLKKIGISDNALKWFSDSLSNRQQYVCVVSSASTLKYIRTGVPQGSILGPLLFLLYINDLQRSLHF